MLSEPKMISVSDYHDFEDIQRHLRILNPEVKVSELGFVDNWGYIGVIYIDEEYTLDTLSDECPETVPDVYTRLLAEMVDEDSQVLPEKEKDFFSMVSVV